MARGPTGDRGDLERVRDASDIVRIIGEHVALKPKGREYVGLCPFHDDHRPSMNVVPAKQIFHCFVCGAGGDVFSFVQKHHTMEFREALEYLAERAGIELKRADRGPGTVDSGKSEITRADLVRANASAADFFRTLLRHTEHGQVGRDLVERRGISPEMVERFGVGLSPDRWDGLLITAQKMGMDPGVFHEAGLLKRRDDGGFYDAFRRRLMFPIHDQIGRVIAFGGRKIREEDDPKYLNSPETRVFEKSGTLYGLHQAARAIQAERVAVVTEGYTDTIACHQAGITNVVATLGTALTARHAAVLRRLCDTVVLLFDGDLAGQKAADRAVEVFIAEELGVRIATLAGVTDAKDPDELLRREGGADLLRRAIASSTDLLRYRYERVRASLGGASPERMNRVIEDEIERLVSLGLNELRPLRRQFIVRQLAGIAGVPERTIERSIPGGRPGGRPGARTTPIAMPESRPMRSRAEELLGCLLCEASLAESVKDDAGALVGPGRFGDGAAARVARAVEDGGGDLFAVLARLGDDGDAKALAVALAEHVFALTDGGKRVREHWAECAKLARLDAARAGGRATGEAGSADRLRRLRERVDAGDRRVLPVPTRAV